MRTNYRTFSAAEITPASELQPLDLAEHFGREAALEVDLGCGDGTFLVARAQTLPERNFLGIERMPGRVRGVSRKIGDLGLTNVRVLPREILPALRQLLPRASVDIFYLLFPDPWPKRRHQNRRVVSREFFGAIARALKPAGELRIATDQRDYFEAMKILLPEVSLLAPSEGDDTDLPASTFEERFRERGLPIYRLTLRKGIASQRSR